MDRQPSEQPRTAVYWRLSGALAVLTEWAEGEEGEGCHWCLLSEGHEGGCPVGEARAILEAEAAAPDPVASPAGPCIFDGCVSRDRHWHGGFPGGYSDPADPEGPPIPFTTEPEPGVRDYNGAVLDPVASPAPLDVERLHRIIGYAGEGIPAWTHKPPPESRVAKFLAFSVRDVHAAINRWSRLEGPPVAEEPS